ncbi:MAG: hypothetical protein PUD74_07225 [Bacteroidales bacterium]|nr:hypothetical protein [Bacteroidales bacterium]
MPLEYLWARYPCRRPVSIRPLPRWDATEVPVGRVVVPKTGQKPPSPREDAPEVPVGRVVVPKTVQKPPLPREDAPEVAVGMVAVPMGLPSTQSGPRRP